MSEKYARIVFLNKSIGVLGSMPDSHCASFMQFKSQILSNEKKNKNFYENMMLFTGKVLSNAFEKHEVPKLEDEICRLFRSSAFNTAQRNQNEETRIRENPHLKDPAPNDKIDQIIKKLEMRYRKPVKDNSNR